MYKYDRLASQLWLGYLFQGLKSVTNLIDDSTVTTGLSNAFDEKLRSVYYDLSLLLLRSVCQPIGHIQGHTNRLFR